MAFIERMSRGIVMCGGGRYLLCAVVNIQVLRHHGCQLPIELWHFRGEVSAPTRAAMNKIGVRVRELPDLPIGFASKPWAIVHSDFDEVMCLDSDNTCIRNPEYLFESDAYRAFGAVFWPDFYRAPANEAWEKMAGMDEPLDISQQESGQLLIDKKRSAQALEKLLEFNLGYDAIKSYLWANGGDKDTFQLAWLATRTPYHMVDRFPGSAGRWVDGRYESNSMVQHDLSGQPLFMHKNGLKWHNVRKPMLSWDLIRETIDPSGSGIEVRVNQFGPHHTHDFFPVGSYRDVEAREVIGDLESVCTDILYRVRSQLWFKAALVLFYSRCFLEKHLSKNK